MTITTAKTINALRAAMAEDFTLTLPIAIVAITRMADDANAEIENATKMVNARDELLAKQKKEIDELKAALEAEEQRTKSFFDTRETQLLLQLAITDHLAPEGAYWWPSNFTLPSGWETGDTAEYDRVVRTWMLAPRYIKRNHIAAITRWRVALHLSHERRDWLGATLRWRYYELKLKQDGIIGEPEKIVSQHELDKLVQKVATDIYGPNPDLNALRATFSSTEAKHGNFWARCAEHLVGRNWMDYMLGYAIAGYGLDLEELIATQQAQPE